MNGHCPVETSLSRYLADEARWMAEENERIALCLEQREAAKARLIISPCFVSQAVDAAIDTHEFGLMVEAIAQGRSGDAGHLLSQLVYQAADSELGDVESGVSSYGTPDELVKSWECHDEYVRAIRARRASR